MGLCRGPSCAHVPSRPTLTPPPTPHLMPQLREKTAVMAHTNSLRTRTPARPHPPSRPPSQGPPPARRAPASYPLRTRGVMALACPAYCSVELAAASAPALGTGDATRACERTGHQCIRRSRAQAASTAP